MRASRLAELDELLRIAEDGRDHLEVRSVGNVTVDNLQLPLLTFALGNPDPALPAVGFFGGVHGLERIGTQVLLVFLRSLLTRLRWDHVLHKQLESTRLVFMPLINPGGMLMGSRANPAGVDLMRNAPLHSPEPVPFLLGGHRFSSALPWYRGKLEAPMEIENLALCQVVREELLPRQFSIALDCHSGFGLRDRLWFPYAHTRTPIANLPDIGALEELFAATYPNHHYLFEPQSRQYLTHGDIWDYLYREHARESPRTFLPLTLEMGSWLWVKKNPRQLFSRQGFFNPVPVHRLNRVLRSHLVWFDFLARAAAGHAHWLPTGAERDRYRAVALQRWYGGAPA